MWTFCRRNPILIVGLIVIPLAFAVSYFESAVGEIVPIPPSPYDARLEEIEREALDEAYRNQIVHVFEVWMKDETGQPARAVTGARRARKAYVEAMTEIAKRQKPLEQR